MAWNAKPGLLTLVLPPVQWESRQLDPTFNPLRADPFFEKLADSDGK
jgi:hypothetical protein